MFVDDKAPGEQQTKADPFTLPSLIVWLEKQPADKTYRYLCHDGSCLLDQYISSVTGKLSKPSPLHWGICGDPVSYLRISAARPQTFGAALVRARAALASAE